MDNCLINISPIDGRYYDLTEEVRKYFSEYTLIRNRVIIEIEWIKNLSSIKEIDLNINDEEIKKLNLIKDEFDIKRCRKSKGNRKNNKT